MLVVHAHMAKPAPVLTVPLMDCFGAQRGSQDDASSAGSQARAEPKVHAMNAPSQLADLADVAEGGGHDDGGHALLLVVCVDAPHGLHARVLVRREVAPLLLLVPARQAESISRCHLAHSKQHARSVRH